MHGTLPVLNLNNGAQLAQTQAMMRWIAQSYQGRNGEKLYPGRTNPEACWKIDSLDE